VVFNSSPSLTTPTIGGGGANFSGSTSGTTNFKAAAAAGTTTITMPAATGTMALTSDIGNGTLTLSTGVGIVSASASFSANQSGAASYSIAHAVPSGATAATLGTNGISSITTDQFGHITAVTTATYLTAASGVSSIAGTANQITASASVGAVTLSLPQNIHTAAEPTFGGATLGNITVGVSTDNTITTSSGNLILTAAGTSTVNASRPLVAATALTNTNKATVFSVSNSSAGAGADFPYNPTQSTRFSIDSTGNVTINGDLTVAGTTYLPTISGTVAWSTQVTGKTYFGSITDGTTAASPGDGTAFKIRTKDGLTAVVTNDDATHGDNVLFGHGNSITIYGSTSGSVVLQPVPVAGTNTLTLPATTGTVVTTGDSGTVTNAMLAGSIATNKLVSSSLTVSAGTGLGGGGSVSLGGSVTLTNAGVLSVNSQTGAVTIAGGTAISVTQASGTVTITNTGVTSAASGTGISISGTGVGPYTGAITITNSDKGSDQAIFKNIAVTGQTTVSAASNTATLNLVGSNITITTDNTTKTVTLTGNAAANNGTITVSAGTGMSGGGSFTVNQSGNSTVTLTNSDPGSSQFIFKNVAVPGQTTIVADTNNDTLTVQAGQVDSTTGIVITTDATTDTLTIAHANTSGQASVDNANGTVIQDITLDTYGHITGIASVDLDARYDARYTLAQVTTAGNTTTNAITVGGLTVNGNVTVNGTTTYVNTTTATLKDPIITLGGADNGGNATSDDAKDRGIEFRWHNGAASKTGFFGWDRSAQKFLFIPDATNTNEVFSGTKGTIDANLEWADVLSKPSPVVTVTLQGDVSGSASATLSSLGNGTITINTTVNGDAVALGTDTTGAYVLAINNGSYLTGGNGPGGSESAVLTLGVDATSANTANKIVARDGSGNFSAQLISANTGINANTSAPILFGCTNAAAGTSGLSSIYQSTSSGLSISTKAGSSYGMTWTGSASQLMMLEETNGTLRFNVEAGYTTTIGPANARTTFTGGNITTSGSVTASSLIKSGGTSGQFLKADGSVDSNTYLTASTGVTQLNLGLITGGGTGFMSVGSLNGSVNVSVLNPLTASITSPNALLIEMMTQPSLTAGTYNNVTVNNKGVVTSASNVAYLTSITNSDLPNSGVSANTYNNVTVNSKGIVTGGSNVSYLTSVPSLQSVCNVGSSTTTGLTVGSAGVTVNSNIVFGAYSATRSSIYQDSLSGLNISTVGGSMYGLLWTGSLGQSMIVEETDGTLRINQDGYTTTIGIGGQRTTFSGGNVTTQGNFIKSGGTSSQFLKADGSVDSNTYLTSAVTSITAGTGITVTGTTTPTISIPQAIGTTSNVAFGALDIGSPNPAFGTPTSGEIRAAGNITAYATSDERLKTNIVKIDNALEKVSQIDGIIYDWNDEYKKDHGGVDGYFLRDQNSGVIAQQVEKVFPNVVGERSDGMKAVRYELLVPLLIEAIKDLKAEIESLKANK